MHRVRKLHGQMNSVVSTLNEKVRWRRRWPVTKRLKRHAPS